MISLVASGLTSLGRMSFIVSQTNHLTPTYNFRLGKHASERPIDSIEMY